MIVWLTRFLACSFGIFETPTESSVLVEDTAQGNFPYIHRDCSTAYQARVTVHLGTQLFLSRNQVQTPEVHTEVSVAQVLFAKLILRAVGCGDWPGCLQ